MPLAHIDEDPFDKIRRVVDIDDVLWLEASLLMQWQDAGRPFTPEAAELMKELQRDKADWNCELQWKWQAERREQIYAARKKNTGDVNSKTGLAIFAIAVFLVSYLAGTVMGFGRSERPWLTVPMQLVMAGVVCITLAACLCGMYAWVDAIVYTWWECRRRDRETRRLLRDRVQSGWELGT